MTDAGDARADDVWYVPSDNFLSGNTCIRISVVVCIGGADAWASISSTCTDCRNWDTRTGRFAFWYCLDPNKLLRGSSSAWRNYLKPMKKGDCFSNEPISGCPHNGCVLQNGVRALLHRHLNQENHVDGIVKYCRLQSRKQRRLSLFTKKISVRKEKEITQIIVVFIDARKIARSTNVSFTFSNRKKKIVI